MIRVLAALLLCSCWGHSFPGWDSTREAGFERMAVARHSACVRGNPCFFVSVCHRESEAYCRENGYPETCGNGELEGSCGDDVKHGLMSSDGGTR